VLKQRSATVHIVKFQLPTAVSDKTVEFAFFFFFFSPDPMQGSSGEVLYIDVCVCVYVCVCVRVCAHASLLKTQ